MAKGVKVFPLLKPFLSQTGTIVKTLFTSGACLAATALLLSLLHEAQQLLQVRSRCPQENKLAVAKGMVV